MEAKAEVYFGSSESETADSFENVHLFGSGLLYDRCKKDWVLFF